MKFKTGKIISVILTLAVLLSVLCAGFGASAAENTADGHKYLSISIDIDTFRDFTAMYCSIYDITSQEEVAKWGSKKGLMAKDESSAVWRFDLDEHGIELDSTHRYSVVFSSDWYAQTETLTIDSYDSAKEYTAVFSGIYTWQHFNTMPVYSYKWLWEAGGLTLGDVNGDRVVDVLDATTLQKIVAEKESLTDSQLFTANVNADETVDILDAADIQKFAANKLTKFKRQP